MCSTMSSWGAVWVAIILLKLAAGRELQVRMVAETFFCNMSLYHSTALGRCLPNQRGLQLYARNGTCVRMCRS